MRFILLLILSVQINFADDVFFDDLVEAKSKTTSKSVQTIQIDELNPFIKVDSGKFYMGTHPSYKREAKGLSRKVRMVSWSFNSGRKIWSEYFVPPLRKETVIDQGFELGQFEVTQEFFELLMSYNPSRYKGAKRPVENLQTSEINKFIEKLNAMNDGYEYKLPTQTQWEYAYRAGEDHTFFFKNQTNYKDYMDVDLNRNPMIGLAVFGWLKGNTSREKILEKQGGTHLSQHQEVGLKPANSWGFHDMVGNVSERTSSAFVLPNGVSWLDSSGSKINSSKRGKISMGGSYKDMASISSRLDFTFAAYPGSRTSTFDHYKSSNLGFRLLRQKVK